MSRAFWENTWAKLSHPVILSEAKDLCTFRGWAVPLREGTPMSRAFRENT
jgi:hypothetical protein